MFNTWLLVLQVNRNEVESGNHVVCEVGQVTQHFICLSLKYFHTIFIGVLECRNCFGLFS